MIHYMDGEFVDEHKAVVPALDWGYLYGDGCFEGVAVVDGTVLDFDYRVERFYKSARALRIDVPVSEEEFRDLLLETAARNGLDKAASGALRPMLTRGVTPIGLSNVQRRGTLRIFASASSESAYSGPIRVASAVLSSVARTTPLTVDARIKFTSYTAPILAKLEARERGADWPIFRDSNGFIAEAATANLFCVSGGKLLTPTLTSALGGITRRRIIDAAADIGVECIETQLTRYDLECADELFLTASLLCLEAIGTIEGIALPHPVPGPITSALRDAYVKAAMREGTPVPEPAHAAPATAVVQ